MRLSAAAVILLAIGITVFLVTPGSQGTTWAEVVKAMGPIESVQYRTSEPHPNGESLRNTTQNYVTATMMRVDTWTQHGADRGPDKTPSAPDSINITRSDGRESADYSVALENGRPTGIIQHVGYSVLAQTSADAAVNLGQGAQILRTWQQLQGLPVEAVLKRGSDTVDGQRLLRFEVIDAVNMPGLQGFQSGTFILVDPRTKQPVILRTGSTTWTNMRFNETISEERFAPPGVPEDLDPEVSWTFLLAAETWNKKGFVFRVLDPKGEPIVTKDDVEATPVPQPGRGRSFGEYRGAEPVEGADPGMGESSMQGWLTPAGVQKLDRFMARNPGAEMTIEITGEPPIKRTVYGRLSRRVGGGYGGGAVRFDLLSATQLKAATQPAPQVAPESGEMEAPGYGRRPVVVPGGRAR